MKTLQIDRQEAEAVYNSDMAIEHKEKQDFDLPDEKKAIAQKYTRTGTRKTEPKKPVAYKFDKKTRKENQTKQGFINELSNFLSSQNFYNISDVKITNKERELEFKLDNEWYRLTFSYCRNKNKAG